MSNREELVTHARDSIALGSKSFALASKLFDPQTRERAWLLYCWCRRCDDIADGQDHGGTLSIVSNPFERLDYIHTMTAQALAGEITGDLAFDALGLVAGECQIPHAWAFDLVRGFAMDAGDFSPRSEADLLTYCYHVAGVVGLMMAAIMGVSPHDEATLLRANDLGLAFQLANIARDVTEDADADRCYLPAIWLAEADIPPGEHMKPHYRTHLAQVAARLTDLAGRYEASARVGAARLPFRSRWAVLAAAGIYGDIAREVKRRGAKAWDGRVITPKSEKLGWVAKAFGQSFRPLAWVERQTLWQPTFSTPIVTDCERICLIIEDHLIEYGLRRPFDRLAPIIVGLGLDDEDWAMDMVPEINQRWRVDIVPEMLTRETIRSRTPIARDISISELADILLRLGGTIPQD